jgi:hypothetical protein
MGPAIPWCSSISGHSRDGFNARLFPAVLETFEAHQDRYRQEACARIEAALAAVFGADWQDRTSL